MEKLIVHTDCLHFNGYKPCKPHKEHGVHCEDCLYYEKSGPNILIIKFAAAGEVIRNTPLLYAIKEKHPNAKIFWITEYPQLVPEKQVYKVLEYNLASIILLKDIEFDMIYQLDKDLKACALANTINAKVKKGFTQKDGVILPFDDDANHKFRTGIFDDLHKQNTKHYIEEIFEICGFKFNNQRYILPEFEEPKVSIDKTKKVVALNTGVGEPWKTRLYSEKNWITLAKKLKSSGYEVIIVGGPEEDEKNKKIAQESNTKYFGLFPYKEYIGLLNMTDIIVTCVTFAFHVGVGLNKKIVLLNNIFNPVEFYMYGNGVILEPDLPCKMCYKAKFDERCPVYNCMDLIHPNKIFEALQQLDSGMK